MDGQKKAMLSQPMARKTEEEIVATRERAVAALEARGFIVVNTLFTNEWYSNEQMVARGVVQIPLCFLAKSSSFTARSVPLTRYSPRTNSRSWGETSRSFEASSMPFRMTSRAASSAALPWALMDRAPAVPPPSTSGPSGSPMRAVMSAASMPNSRAAISGNTVS
jgi:hypothetical protein